MPTIRGLSLEVLSKAFLFSAERPRSFFVFLEAGRCRTFFFTEIFLAALADNYRVITNRKIEVVAIAPNVVVLPKKVPKMNLAHSVTKG
jgi:hypothetical protein